MAMGSPLELQRRASHSDAQAARRTCDGRLRSPIVAMISRFHHGTVQKSCQYIVSRPSSSAEGGQEVHRSRPHCELNTAVMPCRVSSSYTYVSCYYGLTCSGYRVAPGRW